MSDADDAATNRGQHRHGNANEPGSVGGSVSPERLQVVDRCAARTPLIVTCGGPFGYAHDHYDDRVIGYASPSRA
jgi:hypothetical protein